LPGFSEDSLNRAVQLSIALRAEKHRFDFLRHEKKIPPGGMDFAIEDESVY
jgi:hypothetical protein